MSSFRVEGPTIRRRLGSATDYVHCLIDDHSRLAYSEILPDERVTSCAASCAEHRTTESERCRSIGPTVTSSPTTPNAPPRLQQSGQHVDGIDGDGGQSGLHCVGRCIRLSPPVGSELPPHSWLAGVRIDGEAVDSREWLVAAGGEEEPTDSLAKIAGAAQHRNGNYTWFSGQADSHQPPSKISS